MPILCYLHHFTLKESIVPEKPEKLRQQSRDQKAVSTLSDLNSVLKHIKGQSYPPVHLWEPEFCGDIDIRIARDGAWYYLGSPIRRPAMVKLFSSVLRKDEDGYTYLVTPQEKLRIQVDDAPLVAVELRRDGEGAGQELLFRTHVDDWVRADAEHPLRVETDRETGSPSPYIRVRGNLDALINRSTFYEMVELAEVQERDGRRALWLLSAGQSFELGEI